MRSPSAVRCPLPSTLSSGYCEDDIHTIVWKARNDFAGVLFPSADPGVFAKPDTRSPSDMNRWESQKNATDSDVRRMYFRGLKRTLKVDVLPLEEALAVARISPKLKPAKKKPLGPPKQEIVVLPAVVASSLAASKGLKKKEKMPWSVGRAHCGSVLRNPTVQKKAVQSREPAKTDALRGDTPKSKLVSSKVKAGPQPPANKRKKKRSTRPISTYDGPLRFEGGIRFAQGGLPGLGKR